MVDHGDILEFPRTDDPEADIKIYLALQEIQEGVLAQDISAGGALFRNMDEVGDQIADIDGLDPATAAELTESLMSKRAQRYQETMAPQIKDLNFRQRRFLAAIAGGK